MPLTMKGSKRANFRSIITSARERRYGGDKGESFFYPSRNKGKIKRVDEAREAVKRATA